MKFFDLLKFLSQVPSAKPQVPCTESRNLELGTQDLIFETGQRYLSKMCKSNLFDLLTFLSRVPSAEPQTPSSEFQILGLRTQNSELRTRDSGLDIWDWTKISIKNVTIKFLSPSAKCQTPSARCRVLGAECWVPSARCRVPSVETWNSELGTWYLRLDTDIYQKCENQMFLISSNFCPMCQVPNTEPRTLSARCQLLKFGTRNSGFGVRHLALGTKIWEDQKNLIYTFVIDIFVQSQISRPESRNLELGTWGSGCGTWHLGQKFDLHIFDRYLCPISNIKSWVPSSWFRDSVHGTQGLALGTWGQKFEEIKKFDCHIFDRYLYPVSNIKSQVPSSRFWHSALGTRHSAPGTQGLALGDKNLRRSKKFDCHIFDRYLCPVSNIKSWVLSFMFQDLAQGTQSSGFGTVKFHIYICEFWASGVWESGVWVISTSNLKFRVPVSGLGDSMIKLYKSPSAKCQVPSSKTQNPELCIWYLVISLIYKMLYTGYSIFNFDSWYSVLSTWWFV
jgi:hypothetical protein